MVQLYTEHTLRLPDGIDIRYTDSGAPNTPDYTTMVILHGTGYNGCASPVMFNAVMIVPDGFVRLHEHAHKNNLRTIFWNRRDYHGSTKYTDDELADMRAGRKSFQDRLAIRTAWFFQHLTENDNIPKVTSDRKAGGIILVGWSSGNSATLALLADPAVLPKPLYETLEPHLRSLVLYDPASVSLGYSGPEIEGTYAPFTDPDATTLEQVLQKFPAWKFTDRQTISQWTAEETAKYYDEPAAIRSVAPDSALEILRTQTHKALFDQDLAASYFPKTLLSSQRTLWDMCYPPGSYFYTPRGYYQDEYSLEAGPSLDRALRDWPCIPDSELPEPWSSKWEHFPFTEDWYETSEYTPRIGAARTLAVLFGRALKGVVPVMYIPLGDAQGDVVLCTPPGRYYLWWREARDHKLVLQQFSGRYSSVQDFVRNADWNRLEPVPYK
ncbi:hypothetical protein C8R44DRAFT_990589 [Mycena epipterygia]|nr:hypothetical protein C8R44DRAFT_990589 [Mycena epipterygia]